MALVDVLKFRGPQNALVWKWEPESQVSFWGSWGNYRSEELRLGTQLVVNQSFVAVFVKGGQIADIFGPGTYTLSTKNLPILSKIINLPFGNESPFKAEVYYINKAVLMDIGFEISPFNMLDQNFKVPIPITCKGSIAIRAGEVRSFLTKICGSLDVLTSKNIEEYFRGVIVEKVKSAIPKSAREYGFGPMELEACVGDVAENVKPIIADTLERYGVYLELFNIEGISIVDDNPQVKAVIESYHNILSKNYEETLKLQRIGKHISAYSTERGFDTAEAAANSVGQGGNGDSGIMGAVVGMGLAQPVAGTVANVVQGAMNNFVGGQPFHSVQGQRVQSSEDDIYEKICKLKDLHEKGILTDEEFAKKKQELLSKL